MGDTKRCRAPRRSAQAPASTRWGEQLPEARHSRPNGGQEARQPGRDDRWHIPEGFRQLAAETSALLRNFAAGRRKSLTSAPTESPETSEGLAVQDGTGAADVCVASVGDRRLPCGLAITDQAVFVPASPPQVFALADDHSRLSSHMNESSWMMGGGRMSVEADEGNGQAVGLRHSLRLSGSPPHGKLLIPLERA